MGNRLAGTGGSGSGSGGGGSSRRGKRDYDYSDDSDSEDEYRRRRRARRRREREERDAEEGERSGDSEDEEDERRRRRREEQKRKRKKDTTVEMGMPAPPVARVDVQPANDEDEHLFEIPKDVPLPEDDIIEEDDSKKDKKPPQVYGEWGTNNEFHQAAWGCFKLIVYFLFFLVAIFVYINDYNKKACTILNSDWPQVCTLNNVLTYCTMSEDATVHGTTTCNAVTIAAGGQPDNDLAQGCLWTVTGNTTTGVFYPTTTFLTVCRDTETCTDDAETNIKGGMQKLAILLGLLLGVEVVYTWALFQFKNYHYLDFAELDKCSSYLVLMVKVTPSILQLGWIFHLILLLNLLYVYYAHKDSCSGALRADNGKYALYGHCVMYLGGTGALIFISCFVGSWCRLGYPLRGLLYSPSNIDEINPPLGMDCRKCRDRPGTKCFPDATAACKREPNLCRKFIGECCSFCLSTLFNVFCAQCGRVCGACWRDRHFLGP